MKRLISILMLCAFLVVVLVPLISAKPRKDVIAGKRIRLHQKKPKGLNLTDEQKAKMSDLRLALQKKLLPLKSDLQSKMTNLRLLKTEENPNLNKIDKLIDETGKLRTQMQKEKVRHQLEVRKILTPDQRKIWDSRTLTGPGKNIMGRRVRRARIN